MKLLKKSFALLFFIFLALACSQKKPATDGQVIAVKDGDTIEILENGKPLRIRLAEVDAPEKNQDFGTQAKKFASDLCFGKQVRLQRHNTDRYGRVVATVFLPDGTNLNNELVKQGYAWHYKDYSKDPVLANLETDARIYRRGLWAHPDPVAPWEFRKMQRQGKGKKKPAGTKKASTANQTNQTKIHATNAAWICLSKTVKFYHVSPDCSRLGNCSKGIMKTTVAQAAGQGKGRRCSVCG